MAIIGIDLGTTNSLIAVFADGAPQLIENALGDVLTPSVVGQHNGAIVTGAAARARLVTHPNQTAAVFKRTMGAARKYKLGIEAFTSEQLSALILKSLKADAEAKLGEEVTEAIISVPAYFNELQRKAVQAAARLAGIEPRRLINEPTAAALAYGLQDIAQDSTILVFDLGGGTFDVSILEIFEGVMEVKATAGDAYLGGEDFTQALADHIAEAEHIVAPSAKERAALLKIAEEAKLGLSAQHEVDIKARIDMNDIDRVLTREKFEEISTPLLTRLRRPVLRALHDAGLGASDIDRVVLVGGATRMPVIRSLVAKMTRKLPEAGLDPDHVVALGAAVQAALVANDKALDDVVMTDVSAFTLGIETSREMGASHEPGFFLPIIERNTVVPVSREEVVQALYEDQSAVEIRVFQGEHPKVDGNIELGRFSVDLPIEKGKHQDVSVRFTYDVSGLLEVDTRVNSTGEMRRLVIKKLAGETSDDDAAARLAELADIKIHPRDQAENLHLMARIEECYAMARGDDRDRLMNQLARFEQALNRQDAIEIAEAREDIAPLLDDFEAGYVR